MQSDHSPSRERRTIGTLQFVRRGLAVVFLLGVVGTGIELVLLEHTEDVQQWIPLALFGLGFLLFLPLLLRPTAGWLRAFAFCMVVFIASGLLGTWFHYEGNVEFELERTPELSGLALFKAAMGGATPALAPGTMIQLGLIGLLYTFRHPARRRADASDSSSPEML
jgi:hypothetical protein